MRVKKSYVSLRTRQSGVSECAQVHWQGVALERPALTNQNVTWRAATRHVMHLLALLRSSADHPQPFGVLLPITVNSLVLKHCPHCDWHLRARAVPSLYAVKRSRKAGEIRHRAKRGRASNDCDIAIQSADDKKWLIRTSTLFDCPTE